MARTKFSDLRRGVEARPGAKERLAAKRAETLEEIRLYELRHAEAVSQVELAGRLDVTQGAISKLENAEDVRVSTLRQYLEPSVRASSSSLCSTTRTSAVCRSISAGASRLTHAPCLAADATHRPGLAVGRRDIEPRTVLVSARLKDPEAVVAKMSRFGEPLRVMLDVWAYRLVVATEEALDAVATRCLDLWSTPAP